MRKLAWTLSVAVLIAAPAQAQESIETADAWDGVTGAPLLSRDFFSAAVGQTFLAPSYPAMITGFSFYLGYAPFFPPFDQDLEYFAYLMGWDGVGVTDLLYKSPLHYGNTDLDYARTDFDFTGLPLTTGSYYVALLATHEADPYTGFSAYQNVGLVDGDAYADGTVVQSLAGDFSTLTASPWLADPSADLAFEARFERLAATVPEPSTVILLATGLLGLGLIEKGRRRQGAA